MNPSSLSARDKQILWHPFTQHGLEQYPVEITSAKGAYLFQSDGSKLLDCTSSWWVNIHGHGHPALGEALKRQALQLDHVLFGGVTHEPAVRLAERLVEVTGLAGHRVFYSDNGSTAVEVALKAALKHQRNRGLPRNTIAALRGGYHGDTFGAMAAGGSIGYFDKADLNAVPVVHLPVPHRAADAPLDEESLTLLGQCQSMLDEPHIAALIVEPLIQGAAGMRTHSIAFMRALLEYARQRGVLLIVDEVMTGFGRTGNMFALQHLGVVPDMLCLSKALTGGILPLGATLISGEVFDSFKGPDFSTALAHGHSFTGNPISCAVALESLHLFEREQTLQRVLRLEQFYRERLLPMATQIADLPPPRLLGGIFAFEVPGMDSRYGNAGARGLISWFLKRGLLLRPIGNTLYLMPPFCVGDAELALLEGALHEFVNELR
jgi:adenosylmethionine-8-amino-7-oxononanoate aminotransferase